MADPDELTNTEWIDAARETARSLLLLLAAIDRGELVATPLEVARLQGAAAALGAIAGELTRRRSADGSSATEALTLTSVNVKIGL